MRRTGRVGQVGLVSVGVPGGGHASLEEVETTMAQTYATGLPGRPAPGPGYASFGLVLRRHRMAVRMTQEDLADSSGLSVRAIRNLEIGRTGRPQQQSVDLLATALGLDAAERAELVRTAHHGLSDGIAALPAGRCELPCDVPGLVGREGLVSDACAALTSTEEPCSRLVMVCGGPGSGKTSTIVHIAHRIRGAFPDGQLYADLDGSGGRPMPPGAVLGRLLRSLGVTEVPDSVDERASTLRAVLADRKVLLVLDNVGGEAQIRPLLTDSSASAILLASRYRLLALGRGHVAALNALSEADSTLLMAGLAGTDRLRAEPEAAEDIARACANSPLALHIAGSWLAARPIRRVRELADLLADDQRRLSHLQVGDLSARVSIDEYHRGLTPAEQRMLDRLSRLPGEGFDLRDLDMSFPAAWDSFERLLHAHLLVSAGGGRYRLDPLTRLFAAERRDAASTVTRLRQPEIAPARSVG
jgi:transcriptional regulator with XRE-family HTH domain